MISINKLIAMPRQIELNKNNYKSTNHCHNLEEKYNWINFYEHKSSV